MEVTSALLCDFAQVREGLLFVASAGITRLWRNDLPAPMGVMLAAVIELDPVESREPHHILVRVVDEDGAEAGKAEGQFELSATPEIQVGERLLMPMPFDFRALALPRFGAYDMGIYIDDLHQRSINFWCFPPPGS